MDSPAGRTTRRNSIMLYEAAKSGNRRDVHSILRSDPSLAYVANADGNTPLHLAAKSGQLKVAELLLKHSAKRPEAALLRAEDGQAVSNDDLLRVVNHEGNMALHEAVRSGSGEVARLLLEADAGLACVANEAGESPLFLAVDGNFYHIAVCILDSNGPNNNCSCMGRNGMNVMHAASIRIQDKMQFSCLRTKGLATVHSTGFLDDFVDKVLNQCGLDILEKQDSFGWTPLHYAAHLGNIEILKRILKANETLVHIKVNDEEGMSALHIAARNEQTEVIETLLGVEDYREVAELLDNKSRTALHAAVESGKSRAVKTLLRFLTYDLVNRKDEEGNTCLHCAAFYGHVTILIMLATSEKVDKKSVNKAGMNAVDACEASMELGQLATAITTAILRKKGTIPSLERSVNRGTKTAQIKIATQIKKPENELKTPQGTDHKGDDAATEAKGTPTRAKEALEAGQKPGDKGYIYSREDIANMINVNLIVATIIASVTFSAAIAMPGGYNDDGKAILSKHASFKWFLVFDALAFASSAALMFVHFLVPLYSKFVLDETKAYPLSWVIWLTVGSTLAMVLAFVMCTIAVLEGKDLPYYDVGLAGIVTSAVFVLPVALFLVTRIYCFIKEVTLIGLVYGVCYVLTGGKWF